MIINLDKAVLLCATEKKWEMKDKGTSGISYTALIYSDKDVLTCKTDKDTYEKIKELELQKGIAIIAIQKTSFNDKEKVVYQLMEFGFKKI